MKRVYDEFLPHEPEPEPPPDNDWLALAVFYVAAFVVVCAMLSVIVRVL